MANQGYSRLMPEGHRDNRFIRAVIGGAARAATFHVVTTYVIPIGIPLLAGYLVHLQGLPWGYALTAACLAFGGLATGIGQMDSWIERRSIKGKLDFVSIRVGVVTGAPQFRLGVLLQNRSASPVDCEIVKWHTEFDNRVPQVKTFSTTQISIPALGNGWFDDNPIDVAPIPKSRAIQGLLEFELKYGRVNAARKYGFTIKKALSLPFDANGNPLPSTWYDAA